MYNLRILSDLVSLIGLKKQNFASLKYIPSYLFTKPHYIKQNYINTKKGVVL